VILPLLGSMRANETYLPASVPSVGQRRTPSFAWASGRCYGSRTALLPSREFVQEEGACCAWWPRPPIARRPHRRRCQEGFSGGNQRPAETTRRCGIGSTKKRLRPRGTCPASEDACDHALMPFLW